MTNLLYTSMNDHDVINVVAPNSRPHPRSPVLSITNSTRPRVLSQPGVQVGKNKRKRGGVEGTDAWDSASGQKEK